MQEKRINEIVENAYENLIDIVQLNIHIMGGYFPIIAQTMEKEEIGPLFDEVINQLFWKFCSLLEETDTLEEWEAYNSFSLTETSEPFFKYILTLVNHAIENKKSSNRTTLYSLLEVVKEKYPKEAEKTLDTLFDILLNYSLLKSKETF